MKKELKKRLKFLEQEGSGYGKKKKKKKEKGLSQKSWYSITLSNFQFHCYELMSMINGIDPDTYIYADRQVTMLNDNVKVNKLFKRMSLIDWKTPAPISSQTFRGRFATLLILKIAHNSHHIIKHLYENGGFKKKRYKTYNELLSELITTVDCFVTTFLSANLEYTNSLRDILELLVVSEGEEYEILEKLEEMRGFLKENCRTHGVDDGVLCNNIMKMAYVLATNNVNVKKTPKYVEEIDYEDINMMASQIGRLGYAILHRKSKGADSMIYDVFTKSLPEIWSKIDGIDEYPEIIIGTQALELLKLFIDDIEVSRYIDKMIRTP